MYDKMWACDLIDYITRSIVFDCYIHHKQRECALRKESERYFSQEKDRDIRSDSWPTPRGVDARWCNRC